jgi:outer membrane lipoprotein-sorting protein
MDRGPSKTIRAIVAVLLLIASGVAAARAQSPDQAAVIRQIDAAIAARVDNTLGFTDVEHYSVYRDGDETHPTAEMTVRDTYKKGVGKEYTVLSESGSGIILRFGLMPLIDNEKTINLPGNVQKSWFTSVNYEMKLKPGGVQRLNGRDCYVLAITPRGEAPNLIIGTLWADAKDGSLVQIEGVASKSPNAFAGTTHMMRQYTNISGFAMAKHARAESTSMLFGRTVVTIDYSDYHLQLREDK